MLARLSMVAGPLAALVLLAAGAEARAQPPSGQLALDHYQRGVSAYRSAHYDEAIEAFNRLRLPLVVVGDGPETRRLHRLAGPKIKWRAGY